MATNNFSSTIIVEPLTFDNYKSWSAWMKNYLLAQDLWDIVEGTVKPEDDSKAWRKNNAAALHAIQISCAPNILSKIEIEDISSAKTVWDKLAKICVPDSSFGGYCDNSDDVYHEAEILHNLLSATTVEQPAGSVNNSLLDQYERLRTAINNGDSVANSTAGMSVNGRTLLHVAVFAGQTEIVQRLVELMSEEELEITDDKGFTALALATILQKRQMVECMLTKNFYLLNIKDGKNRTPLIAALAYGNIEMAIYVYSLSLSYNIPDDRTSSNIYGSTILTHFIFLNQFDRARHFLKRNPRAAILPNLNNTFALSVLAMNSSAFPSGNAAIPIIRSVHGANDIQIEIDNLNEHQNDQEGIIRSVLGLLRLFCSTFCSTFLERSGIKQRYEMIQMKLLHHQARDLLSELCNEVKKMKDDVVMEAMLEATKGGIVEFIEELVKADTSLLHYRDRMGRNILFYAVLHRQPKIFSYICKKVKAKNSITNVVDKSGSTILHMAAMLAPSTTRDHLPSEALKMQSEIRWFKKVERICPPWIKQIRNDTKMTAKELFTHNHMNMMKGGEKWTKETASACTVIGALIITIMFTAAFTVPGGNNQDTGFPMFSQKGFFTVFIVADALSLFASSASVLVFLGIVTSRYAEEDFSQSLPLKMIIGYYTLFFSIVTMMIAFCAGLFVMLPEKSWIVSITTCLATGIVFQFASMLFNLVDYFLDEVSSTFGSSNLF